MLGRPACFSGRFDVTRSVKVPQPLKIARVVASAQDCESRFIIGSDQVHAKSKHSGALSTPFCRASRSALFPVEPPRVSSLMHRKRLTMRSTPLLLELFNVR